MKHRTQPESEFFIGSERVVPPLQRRFLYHRLFGIFGFAFALALLIPALQNRYEPSFQRYLSHHELEGVLFAAPVPFLMVDRPGSIGPEQHDVSTYLLVHHGKSGFPAETAAELDGKTVRLKGSLLFNRTQTVIEVDPKNLRTVSYGDEPPHPSLEQQALGRYKLTGVIVDSKCYYGALNPGFGKTHRACSVRSIANGIPPLLLVRGENGETLEFLITGTEGQSINTEILDFVEVPVRVTGDVFRWGNKYVIQTDVSWFETLDS
jgi:hypothetical protein